MNPKDSSSHTAVCFPREGFHLIYYWSAQEVVPSHGSPFRTLHIGNIFSQLRAKDILELLLCLSPGRVSFLGFNFREFSAVVQGWPGGLFLSINAGWVFNYRFNGAVTRSMWLAAFKKSVVILQFLRMLEKVAIITLPWALGVC
ncbi:hypothetical protein TNIN_292291 [Trichonephila inaurata madagascariensis]|uniref:Uncharacterized protein n=1 Tax=Trichonephila inaurata madagascariensis TaxID=2747483 RepID=A0A8X7CPA0_9ARAC|nr:hypothetical protein TNIN_292291 [Trichonephila inaurata madagascariensis]